MEEKIFNALKQAYSPLGLGDAVLKAQAETLAALGFVTDENLDAVVKAAETGLKAVQASNDKRVADALTKANLSAEKAKETLTKSAEEQQAELKKQIEEWKAQAELNKSELQKQQAELKEKQALQKQLETLQKQAEKQQSDFNKRKADLLALINGEPPEPKAEPTPEPVKQPEPQPPTTPAFDADSFRKTLTESLTNDFSKKMTEYVEASAKQTAKILETNKSLAEQVQTLVRENAEYKAKQAAENRKNFILNKAHELQIPEWRISEGFTIAEDANEEAITDTLTTVSNNIRANMLPQGGVNVPNIGGSNPDTQATIENIAAQLVQNH